MRSVMDIIKALLRRKPTPVPVVTPIGDEEADTGTTIREAREALQKANETIELHKRESGVYEQAGNGK